MGLSERIASIWPSELPEDVAKFVPQEGSKFLSCGSVLDWKGPSSDVYSCLRLGAEQIKLGASPNLTSEQALVALEHAVKAYEGEWPRMNVLDRISRIKEFTYKMQEHREQVVALEMLEIGKNRQACEKEFDRTIAYIHETCRAYDEMHHKKALDLKTTARITRSPHGVALCMGPFNYPVNESLTTIIPALLTGNTVVAKAPRLGMLCTTPLYEAFADSFPPGVINIINGDGREVITPIMESGKVDAFSFIGSCRAYDAIVANHPNQRRLKVNAGLEAKNYAIVLPDAYLEKTVKTCVSGALTFNGQRCTALKRIYVHENIADMFVERLVDAVSNLSFGMPWENPDLTPLADIASVKYLQKLVEDAQSKGAKVLNPNGGEVNETYFHPAVVYPVRNDMRLAREEQFGPIVAITPYRDLEEPLSDLGNSNYGQQASIFGRDRNTILELIRTLSTEVSRVNVNAACQRGPDMLPFTGRKDSAVGSLSITDALEFFSQPYIITGRHGY